MRAFLGLWQELDCFLNTWGCRWQGCISIDGVLVLPSTANGTTCHRLTFVHRSCPTSSCRMLLEFPDGIVGKLPLNLLLVEAFDCYKHSIQSVLSRLEDYPLWCLPLPLLVDCCWFHIWFHFRIRFMEDCLVSNLIDRLMCNTFGFARTASKDYIAALLIVLDS